MINKGGIITNAGTTKPVHVQPADFHTIRWSVEDGIGLLLIGHPPSNSMTMEFFAEFRRWMKLISEVDALNAIVIHGNGRHFSSGADLDELLENVNEATMLDNYHCFSALGQLEIPVISAISGICLGSAFELALMSHFRICSANALVGLPEAGFNLMPGIGGISSVANLTGRAGALEIVMRGMSFAAADALEMGLVDAVVSKQELLPCAMNFARALPGRISREGRKIYILKYLTSLNACKS
ncbi:MAG: enoyl-CoA hydratase/isomerase family protein [Bacteroidota bacterium]